MLTQLRLAEETEGLDSDRWNSEMSVSPSPDAKVWKLSSADVALSGRRSVARMGEVDMGAGSEAGDEALVHEVHRGGAGAPEFASVGQAEVDLARCEAVGAPLLDDGLDLRRG
ncbi:MAG: hypothetical protein R2715_20045 [Ilumatobacteraceae bacterium]